MSFVKKAGAWVLTLALLASLLPMGLVSYADGEDVTFTLSKVELYDEATHEITDVITEANPGDVIAVTLSVTNNTGSSIKMDGVTQHFSFDPQTLSVYLRDETDIEEDGDFSSSGYKVFNGFTGAAGAGVAGSGEATPGISNVNVGSSGVSIKKNASMDLIVFLYKILPTATAENVTISFAENDKNLYTFQSEVTHATGDALSLKLNSGEEPASTYAITYPGAANGNSVTGKAEEKAGEPVTLTVTTATDYELKSLTAKGTEDAAAVEVTKVNDTTYTFTMPAKPVTVEATFEQTQTENPENQNADVTFTLSKVELYDEATHEITDVITEANPGDVIAVTLSVTNNTGSAIKMDGITQHFSFDPQTLAVYLKDETDTEEDGDFSSSGYKVFNGFTGAAGAGVAGSGEATPGISNVNVGSSGVSIKKNASMELIVFLYKILPTATAESATISFAENDKNLYTFQSEVTHATGDALSVKLNLGDEPTPHSVTCPTNLEGGTVTASAESAVKDTDIRLTVTPNKGYGVSEVRLNGQPLNAPYTFKMPDEDVTIVATFGKLPYDITYVSDPTDGGTVTSEGDLKTATIGTEITLKAEPAEGYQLDTLTVEGKETKNIPVENGKFTMPAENVTVTATFFKPNPTYSVDCVVTPAEGGAVKAEPTSAKKNSPVKVTVTPNAGYDVTQVTADGKELTPAEDGTYSFNMPDQPATVEAQFVKHPYSIWYGFGPEGGGQVNGPDNAVFDEEVTVNLDVADGYRPLEVTVDGEKVEDVNGVVTFTMPKNDVEVNVTFAKLYNIKYVASPTNGGSVKDGSTEAVLGEEIELTATANEDADYDFVEFTVVGDESEKPVEVKDGNKFVMPEENVTVTAWFTQPTRTIDSVATPAEGGAVKTDPTSAKKGSAVKVTVTPKAGYSVEKVTMNGEELTQVADGTYVFTMPAEPVTVEATFAQQTYKITYTPAQAEGGSVKDGPTESVADKEVSVSLNVNDGYRLSSVTVNGEKVEDVNGVVTFKMPAEDVEVKVTFVKLYNIKYESAPEEGGSVTGSTQAQAGEEVIARLTVNDGYTPSVTVDGVKVEDVNGAVTFKMPDKDVTVQVTFTRPQVAVTLVTNDGQKVDPLYVTTGEKIAKLGDRIWNNHTFAGWYADAEYKTEFDFDAPITGDTTIYAKWTVTVTFDANGGAFGEAETTEVQATVGNPIVPPEEKPTRNGYEFTAWLTEKKDAPTPEDAFDFSVPARDPVTIYAGWLKGAISVTYSTIGNGKIDGPTAVRPGDEITVKASPSGDYAFSSWNITSDVADIFNDVDRDPAEQPIPEYTFTVPENATSVTVEATFIPTKCYIATSVYGSYDTPEVWTLRRFRDDVLGETWYGRLFIKAYYATSPTLVHWFGDAEWFQNFWRDKLDTLVDNLQEDGFESTPYQDKDW